jgi:DNA-binding MarR family transcriptional regulator
MSASASATASRTGFSAWKVDRRVRKENSIAQIIDIVNDVVQYPPMSDGRPKSRKAGDLSGFTDHPGPHLFREIVRAHQVLIGAFSREVGMSAARIGLLRQLANNEDGSLGAADLARALGVTPAIVTRQVQELEADGVLCRRNAPRDRRRSQLCLTSRGRRALEQLHERAHRMQTEVLNGLSNEQIAAACHVLSTVRVAIETQRSRSSKAWGRRWLTDASPARQRLKLKPSVKRRRRAA